MSENGDTTYERYATSALVDSQPCFAEALVAATRNAVFNGTVSLRDGFSGTDRARLMLTVPKKSSVIVVFEYPPFFAGGLYFYQSFFAELTTGHGRR